jgi:2-polyprenyl-3-methyl-5-hydroxy-6-metoxy-1,4-benzoquinol methylase
VGDAGNGGTQALVERLFGAVLGAMDVQSVYLGDKLGFYRALDEAGALDAAGLASATGASERYAREWLEHQAVTGFLAVDDAAAAPERRRYSLPPGHREVLVDPASTDYVAALARSVGAAGLRLNDIADAVRADTGVSWARYGLDMVLAQGDANRSMFVSLLGEQVLPTVPDVHDRLSNGGGRVADVGCGVGWSSIAIGASYPGARVDGFDVDQPSIELARQTSHAMGLHERVRFHLQDVSDPSLDGEYDLVAAFECVHDVPRPVEFLASMGRLAKDDGAIIVMDERVAESFAAPGDEIERLMYGYSITICLPDALAHRPTAATGTVMRPATLAGYAREAGFSDVEILPFEHDFFRFYRLHR